MTTRSGFFARSARRPSVLFLEDDDLLRSTYATLGEELGATLYVAGSGAESTSFALDVAPDVLVAETFRGVLAVSALVRTLRAARSPRLWAIGVTSDSTATRTSLRCAGFDDLLRKPFGLEVLDGAIALGLTWARSSRRARFP